MSAMTMLVYRVVYDILVEEASKRGIAELSEETAKPELKEGFRAGSEKTLLPMLITLQENSGFLYIEALSLNGTVLAHTSVSEKGKAYSDRETMEELKVNKPLFHKKTVNGKTVIDISYPVWPVSEENQGEEFLLTGDNDSKTKLGILRAAVSLKQTGDTAWSIWKWVFLIIGAAYVMALLFISVFSGKIIKQLDLLVKAAEHIGHGTSAVQVPVLVSDEIGDLARRFNLMSRELEETTVSKDFMDGILKSMMDVLIVTDKDGLVKMANKTALKLTGYAEDEMKGRSLGRFLTGDSAGLLLAAPQSHQEDTVTQKSLDTFLLAKSGEKIPVIAGISRLYNGNGGVSGLVVSAKDVSDRKKLEAMLLQSEKLSAVGQLAAGVAHEINNPMGVILGFAQALKSRVKPEDPLSLPVGHILREAERCKSLVQNLLTFSRASKAEERQNIDLNTAVEEALSLIQAQGKMKEITLVKELSSDSPAISANKNQIQQIVVNLGTNAIDAMPRGGRLTVKTFKSEKNGKHRVALVVEDTGSGIPKDIQSRIFDPFFTTKEVGKGTGLGLSLVHEIAQKYRAFIELESEEGKGTAFSIFFPAV